MNTTILIIAEAKSPLEAVLRSVLNDRGLSYERVAPADLEASSPFSSYGAVIVDLMSVDSEQFPSLPEAWYSDGMLILPIGLTGSAEAWAAIAPETLRGVQAFDVSDDWDTLLPAVQGEEAISVHLPAEVPDARPVEIPSVRNSGRALYYLLCAACVLTLLAGAAVVVSAQIRAEKEAANSRTVTLSNAQLREAAETAERERLDAQANAEAAERMRLEAEEDTKDARSKAEQAKEELYRLQGEQERAKENLEALESRLKEAEGAAENDKEEIQRLKQQMEEQAKNLSEREKELKEALEKAAAAEQAAADAAKRAAQPAAPAEQQPAAPAEQQPAAPAEQQPAAPAEQQPAAPAEQQPAAPAEQQPAAPAEQQPAAPAEQQPAAPAEQQPAASGEKLPPSPLEEKKTAPEKQEPVAPTPSAGNMIAPQTEDPEPSDAKKEDVSPATPWQREEPETAPNAEGADSGAQNRKQKWSDMFDQPKKDNEDRPEEKKAPEPDKPSHTKNSFGDIIGDR